MSGAKRPGFVGSPSANNSILTGDQKFLKIKNGESAMLRFLPAPKEDGILFYPVTNHYGLKNQESKDIAIACLHQHGNKSTGKDCLLCAVNRYFQENSDELGLPDKVAKALQPSTRFYTQVLVANIVDKKIAGWSGPKLIAWSKTAAQNIQTVFENQEKFGDALAYHPDEGQALIISRSGEGFQTKYSAERTGKIVSLDEIRPEWTTEFIEDLYGALGLNVADAAEQATYLRITFPALDWDTILPGLGFEVEADDAQ